MFDLLRAKGGLSPAVQKDVKKMEKNELENYKLFKRETMAMYNKIWYELLSDNILYKKPFMGNGHYLSEIQHPEKEQLYVFPCFMRPGKHDYVVIEH